jgi:transcriptional regulator with XRE-family HTH domain
MGRRPRLRPERLPEKLRQIRESLGLSQTEMLNRLGFNIHYSRISEYELGKNEPPLPIILRYARIAGVIVDVLIDDELDLPEKGSKRSKK